MDDVDIIEGMCFVVVFDSWEDYMLFFFFFAF